ncbi:MAG: hypothetical protein ACOYNS_14535 [Bacteroidota bacterium]
MRTLFYPLSSPEQIYRHPFRFFILAFFFTAGFMFTIAALLELAGAPLDVPMVRIVIFSFLVGCFQTISSFARAKREIESTNTGPL